MMGLQSLNFPYNNVNQSIDPSATTSTAGSSFNAVLITGSVETSSIIQEQHERAEPIIYTQVVDFSSLDLNPNFINSNPSLDNPSPSNLISQFIPLAQIKKSITIQEPQSTSGSPTSTLLPLKKRTRPVPARTQLIKKLKLEPFDFIIS